MIRHLLHRVWDAMTRTTRQFAADHLAAYAAQATFYLMLAVFPFTMLICMATRLLPVKEETLLKAVRILLPESYHAIGTDFIDSYYNENIGAAKIVLIVFLIWTASRLIQALINGFNTVYRNRESRSQTVLRFVGCLYTVVLCAMLVVLLVMYALSTRLIAMVLAKLPTLPSLGLIADLTRNLASPLLLLLMFLVSYVLLPSHKVRVRDQLPGALLTAAFWRAMASLYSIFLELSLKRYAVVYGSLSGVVMILVWIYAGVYCWFIGAELNSWLARRKRAGQSLPHPKELIAAVNTVRKHTIAVEKDDRSEIKPQNK